MNEMELRVLLLPVRFDHWRKLYLIVYRLRIFLVGLENLENFLHDLKLIMRPLLVFTSRSLVLLNQEEETRQHHLGTTKHEG